MTPKFNEKIIPLITDPASQNFKRRGINADSIPTLNAAVEGFEKGELIIITAAPGGGKTQLARTLIMDFIEQGLNCLYLSFEVKYNQLLGFFMESGLGNMAAKLEILKPEQENEQDITFVEKLAEQEFDILVVDDLHALEEKYSFHRNTDNMSLVMRGLAQRLKNIALNKNKIVISMVHSRKDSIDKSDSSLSDIAYSGGVAQVADTVLSIKTEKDTGYAIIEITKARYSGSKKRIKCQSINKKFKEIYALDTQAKIVNSFLNRS